MSLEFTIDTVPGEPVLGGDGRWYETFTAGKRHAYLYGVPVPYRVARWAYLRFVRKIT